MRSWSSSYIEVQEKEVNSYHVQVTSFSGIMNKGLAHHHQAGPIGQTHDQLSILEGTMGAFPCTHKWWPAGFRLIDMSWILKGLPMSAAP